MTEHEIVKKQLLHMVVGTLIFAVLAFFAVALDLVSAKLMSWGVSSFTSNLLSYTAHGLLVVDIILFVMFVLRSSWDLAKETFK